MPDGFVGTAALRYLNGVSEAHTNAKSDAARAARPPSSVPPDTPSVPTARMLPHEPSEANHGRFTTGKGNSGNIVVDETEYAAIMQKISHIDDKIGEHLYRIAAEIENMCRESYILPATFPRCTGISSNIKTSMGQFRALTEEATGVANRFARDITSIG